MEATETFGRILFVMVKLTNRYVQASSSLFYFILPLNQFYYYFNWEKKSTKFPLSLKKDEFN